VGSIEFPQIQLIGFTTSNSTFDTLDITDATGTGDGWDVQLTSTQFTDGTDTLSPGAAAVTATRTPACDLGSTCALPPVIIAGYPVGVPAGTTPPTAAIIYSTSVGTGMGAINCGLSYTLEIPSNAGAGLYTATWMYTLTQSPAVIGTTL